MSIAELIISKLAPHDCLGCGYEGHLVCGICKSRRFQAVSARCYRCRRVMPGSRTCQSCRKVNKLRVVSVAVVYEGLSKELVWQLKFKGARGAAREMAGHMLSIQSDSTVYLVPVPTATSRARQRGYDQAKLLARELSRRSGLPYLDCLRRSGQAHQVGASRKERLNQLKSAFRVNSPALIKRQHIMLIDDVITTGATLEAAASALKQAGAKSVEAAVFAQP